MITAVFELESMMISRDFSNASGVSFFDLIDKAGLVNSVTRCFSLVFCDKDPAVDESRKFFLARVRILFVFF